jgi:hypothetical protein
LLTGLTADVIFDAKQSIQRVEREPVWTSTLKSPMSQQSAEHHTKAAEHHEHAARHHKEAAKHYASGSHEKAGHHAHVAHGHHLHATHHAEEAAKHHVEEHGSK